MKIRKKGYPVLLAVTVLFTLSGALTVAVPATMLPGVGDAAPVRLGTAMGLFLAAGLTCIIRKRVFVEQT